MPPWSLGALPEASNLSAAGGVGGGGGNDSNRPSWTNQEARLFGEGPYAEAIAAASAAAARESELAAANAWHVRFKRNVQR